MPQETPVQPDQSSAALERKEVSILSPLRYPGSKRRLASYIKQALKLNDLHPSLFVEPFAGGASVALQLLSDDAVECVLLADIDPFIADFWDCVFNDSEWLIEQVRNIDVTVEQWRKLKHSTSTNKRDRALACLFLNRTSFSGIMAPQVGPIGGWAQKSDYKIDCRFPRPTIIKRLQQASRLRDKVEVWNLSWDETVARVQSEFGQKSSSETIFFYFDPPFFEKADKLYAHYFKQEEHVRFRDAVMTLHEPWILSYDVAKKAHELYDKAAQDRLLVEVEVLYSTAESAGSKPVREIILTNLKRLPDKNRLWRTSEEWSPSKANGHSNGNGTTDASSIAPGNDTTSPHRWSQLPKASPEYKVANVP
jgi:DNA adenine methylase